MNFVSNEPGLTTFGDPEEIKMPPTQKQQNYYKDEDERSAEFNQAEPVEMDE